MGYLLSLFFGDEYFVVPMLPISFNGKILRHMRVFYSPSGTVFYRYTNTTGSIVVLNGNCSGTKLYCKLQSNALLSNQRRCSP